MKIIKQQWDELSIEEKNRFEEEVGEIFNKDNFPGRNHVLIFLGNNKIHDSKSLKAEDSPSASKEIGDLWKNVVDYLKSS